MSAHIRTQIRAALVAALSGLPRTGDRVHANRQARLGPADMPCIIVGTPRETLRNITITWPAVYQREAEVLITVLVSGDDRDNLLDAIGLDIELALSQHSDLGGLLKTPIDLREIRTEFDDTTSPPVAALLIHCMATTMATSASPDTVY